MGTHYILAKKNYARINLKKIKDRYINRLGVVRRDEASIYFKWTTLVPVALK